MLLSKPALNVFGSRLEYLRMRFTGLRPLSFWPCLVVPFSLRTSSHFFCSSVSCSSKAGVSRSNQLHSGQGRLNQATTGCKCKSRFLLLPLNAPQTNNQNEASCELEKGSKSAARHSLKLPVQILTYQSFYNYSTTLLFLPLGAMQSNK